MIRKIYRKVFPLNQSTLEKKLERFKEENSYPKVFSIDETLDLIIEKQLSISRFGDGEFSLCLGKSLPFQPYDSKLAERLEEILKYEFDENAFLPSIIDFKPEIYNLYWKEFWFNNFNAICTSLNQKKGYGDAALTRNFDVSMIEKFRKIWDFRRVVFVIGNGGRFKMPDALFDNVADKSFVQCPPEDAWKNYDAILNRTKTFNRNALILISLGPTASVLAFDLYKLGYQAIDIGHLPNAYLNKIGKGVKAESLPVSQSG